MLKSFLLLSKSTTEQMGDRIGPFARQRPPYLLVLLLSFQMSQAKAASDSLLQATPATFSMTTNGAVNHFNLSVKGNGKHWATAKFEFSNLGERHQIRNFLGGARGLEAGSEISFRLRIVETRLRQAIIDSTISTAGIASYSANAFSRNLALVDLKPGLYDMEIAALDPLPAQLQSVITRLIVWQQKK